MQTLAVGNSVAPHGRAPRVAPYPPRGPCFAWGNPARRLWPCTALGFTLLELMIVVAIIAMASAGVSFAMRDSAQSALEREGQRLAVLLDSARAQSRASGVAVRWRVTAQGFRFEGLPTATLPQNWLGSDTQVNNPNTVLLGPEPLIGPQDIALSSLAQPARVLHVVTDGLQPFSVRP